jgi:hypothetical protein
MMASFNPFLHRKVEGIDGHELERRLGGTLLPS